MPDIPDLKHKGLLGELAFVHHAISLGCTVSKPYGDNAQYDVIVDTGARLYRVQIRSISRFIRPGYQVSCMFGKRTHRIFTAREIDMLAAFIAPEEVWYIIPVDAFAPAKSIFLKPAGNCRFEPYREAWHLLR